MLEIPKPPPDRGRLLTADDVRAMIGGGVALEWVYANVPHKLKISYRMVRWYEDDVRDWLEGLRGGR